MYKRYGFLGCIKLIIAYINTKLFFSKSRLIRLPFDVRNKHLISFGEGLTTGIGCRFEAYELQGKTGKLLRFGNNVQVNDYVHITAMNEVVIDDNVLIASKVYISDCSHGSYKGDHNDSSANTIPKDREYHSSKIHIQENVWIGEFVSILPGVTIGKGAIIGTMSVVSKSIPPYCIAVGAPAKVIKRYNFKTERWERV
ncbi:LbetaH domain-containing protein [Pedobacter gandavensis]|uniref:Acetyltransferase n=1 Tax=Pedobacter gandavensis TaxID=2679963 RepID=A0ABR6EYH4_9SPHI|nr:acetyltransferase [Pedobacter gandavensis]MBB2149894.1 acetyltransferase [Pedobacter gandavensis]